MMTRRLNRTLNKDGDANKRLTISKNDLSNIRQRVKTTNFTKILIIVVLCVIVVGYHIQSVSDITSGSSSSLISSLISSASASSSSLSLDANDQTTGAWANCTKQSSASKSTSSKDNHPDQKSTIVSCRTIPYRVKASTFQKVEDIIIGVLSGAGGLGPERRQAIRDTWATKGIISQNIGVFFLVAGPWEGIQKEYETKGDLVWIDEEEVYNGEQSVLTYKTQSFIRIVHDTSKELGTDIKYIFKTDDDSYVHVRNLYHQLMEADHDQPYDYWGWCQLKKYPPKRDSTAKWPVSYEIYPEAIYPRYCQGAGFALSKKFVDCASNQNHISMTRFMPFEDASIGLVAERCGIVPTMIEKRRWINLYRTGLEEEKNRVRDGLPKIDKSMLTRPIMLNRIVQHRIYDTWDMNEHHQVVMDPKKYNKESKVKWYSPPS